MSAKTGMSLGRWLSRLIEQAADKSDAADIPADDFAAIVARIERLESAVFTADKSDMADMEQATQSVSVSADMADTNQAVMLAPVAADMSDKSAAGATAPIALDTADRSDTADIESSAALCRTAADKSDSEMPACGAIAVRTRLLGDAKAERAADIKRRLAAGESKPIIMAALGISIATLNRALT